MDGFAQAARSGFAIGRGQDGGAVLPAGLPEQARQQVLDLIHSVFVNGFVAAVRPTVMTAVVVLGLAALSCLLVVQRPRSAEAEIDAPARAA